MQALLQWLIDLVMRAGHWSYAVIFAAAALESAAFLGLFVPGEALVLVSGFLSAQGSWTSMCVSAEPIEQQRTHP